jgi:hypothetical protein
MRLIYTLLILSALILAPVAPARAYTLQYTSQAGTVQIHWPTTTITVALSTSFNNPPSFVHATAAQATLAARRALAHWAQAANIQFNVTSSTNQDVGTDGVNLITIADTPANRNFFGGQGLRPGKANVVFDNSGNITEADVVINPQATYFPPGSATESPAFFSTDGTANSYDLESTLTHEIGHLLGLEHSGIVGATMQPRQGVNGTYNLPNFTTRSLSTDDVAGVRSIYGPKGGLGSIAGTATYTSGAAAFGAHVFAEDATTGRVVAGNVALSNGSYKIDALPPGQYKVVAEYLDEPVLADQIGSNAGGYSGLSTGSTTPFLTTEAGTATVNPDASTTFNVSVPGGTSDINATFIGTGDSGQLSKVAVPVVPGGGTAGKITILVGLSTADNVAQVSVTSSHFSQATNIQHLNFGIPVISFDVTPDILTPPGEYDVRLQSTSGQVSYVTGGLTVDLPNGVPANTNLIDNTQFYVAQQYRDFLSREADASGFQFWTSGITSCGADANCVAVKRVDTSAAFFLSIEFQSTGFFVYDVYKAAFGNIAGKPVPVTFNQFFPDTQRIGQGVVVGQGNWQQQLDENKQSYVFLFVQRADFQAAHGSQDAATLVDSLFRDAGVTPTSDERNAAINAFNNAGGGTNGRAAALRSVAESKSVTGATFNEAFVLMQYFGYLRRNPDDPPDSDFSGFNFWLTKLNQFNGNYVNAEMVKAFITSIEYRQRFGS